MMHFGTDSCWNIQDYHLDSPSTAQRARVPPGPHSLPIRDSAVQECFFDALTPPRQSRPLHICAALNCLQIHKTSVNPVGLAQILQQIVSRARNTLNTTAAVRLIAEIH